MSIRSQILKTDSSGELKRSLEILPTYTVIFPGIKCYHLLSLRTLWRANCTCHRKEKITLIIISNNSRVLPVLWGNVRFQYLVLYLLYTRETGVS